MKDSVRAGEGKKDVTRCPYCHESCGPDGVTACPSCEAPHHADCWTSGGGCATCAIARDRAPVGSVVAPAGQRALSLNVARETLVRAGHGLTEVDALLRPPGSEVLGWREALVLLTSLLVVLVLVSGAIGTYFAVLHATARGTGDALAIAATAGFVGGASLLLLVPALFRLARRKGTP